MLRRALFALPPESAHALTLLALRAANWLPPRLSRPSATAIQLAGLRFPNRLGLTAGFDKNATAVDALARLDFGFIEVGTVTAQPQPGNPRPRVFRRRSAGALINRMGFPNDGATLVAKRLQRRHYSGVLGVNIGKNAVTPNEHAAEDYLRCFDVLRTVADYIAINVSSPNTAQLRELQRPEHLDPILQALSEARSRHEKAADKPIPLFLKISPDLDDSELVELAAVVRSSALDGVIATNTTIARPPPLKGSIALEPGGLSGRPLFPRALAVVRRMRALLPDTVVIGCGGIQSAADACQMLEAGADLIQLYTGLVYRGPRLVSEILQRLQQPL